MSNRLIKNKSGEKFSFGMIAILLSITISMLAFISEENKITGFATFDNNLEEIKIIQIGLIQFNDVDSLSTLSAGNYYIDGNGIVYWIDDESRPAIAKVNFVDESQKNRHIYIDNEGRIGYVLKPIEENEN